MAQLVPQQHAAFGPHFILALRRPDDSDRLASALGSMEVKLNCAIVFDMDGVIFQTTRPKHDAMLCLFPDEQKGVASQTIMRMGGVPRKDKLAQVHKACFGRLPSNIELRTYLARYEFALHAVLAKPVATPGIESFLELISCPCFVNSSAPISEVNSQLRQAGLDQYFSRIYGAPALKTQVLQNIKRQVKGLDAFFGDASADRDAASAAGVAFVAVVGETDQFPNNDVPKIKDFVDAGAVVELVNCALLPNAS